MHASLTFKILRESEKNILENLANDQFLLLRKWVIEMILVTDMAKHFDLVNTFRLNQYSLKEIARGNCKLETLKLIIHSADIGHSAKEKNLHRKWSGLICEEFFNQGDIEKENDMPVSMYCDKETTILAKSQIGFLKNISLPLFEILTLYLDSEQIAKYCLEQLKNNLQGWEDDLYIDRKKTLKIPAFISISSEGNSNSHIQNFISFTPSNRRLNK